MFAMQVWFLIVVSQSSLLIFNPWLKISLVVFSFFLVIQASEEQEFLTESDAGSLLIEETPMTSEFSGDASERDKMHVINFHGSDSCVADIKRSVSCISTVSSAGEFCRICHCERNESNDQPLIRPCLCSGTLMFVHQSCLQKWIKSSDIKKCELCQYKFVMEAKVKPFRKVCSQYHRNCLSINYSLFLLQMLEVKQVNLIMRKL